ncbi:torsin-1A-interacting protein 2-like isoform X5 [Sebastes umbrosus]|uniref:torsin-1A-interacting protein 2-like isoform X5 n=1 Tax=Sebastes umbrosus TaxID=72105 RepID=UPI00189FCAEC|nr:torsin-1A-interacting protein 2-like isoform X5 [Sebastes umbrosus]
MAEQDRDHHHTAEGKEEETPSTNMDHVSAFDESKQEETDIIKQQLSEDSASSSASTNRETNNDNGGEMEMPDVKNDDSAEKRTVPPTEGSSPSDDDTMLIVKESSSRLLQADKGSHGDYNREAPRNEQPTVTAEEISNDGSDLEKEENDVEEITTSYPQTEEDVETIGPATAETAEAEPAAPVVIVNHGGSSIYPIAGILVLVLAMILGQHLFQPESPPQKDDVRQIDIFLGQLEKVKTQFPHQRAELWSRSKIHLLRHLQTAQPTEPVSLILTAGHRAERTLHCLAQSLASAFSSSLNASFLHIDGASKASQDSDQVKLDIDSKLQGAFEGDKPVAVINRFEELPPGSTLIFYRYCDHENAAYKKTCLIFTVLLGEEEEIPADTRLSAVEEMVDDHLQKKFLSDGHPVSFDRMDLDKYGGLWSRISHLILPVAAEERIEHEGC